MADLHTCFACVEHSARAEQKDFGPLADNDEGLYWADEGPPHYGGDDGDDDDDGDHVLIGLDTPPPVADDKDHLDEGGQPHPPPGGWPPPPPPAPGEQEQGARSIRQRRGGTQHPPDAVIFSDDRISCAQCLRSSAKHLQRAFNGSGAVPASAWKEMDSLVARATL